jgi:hypothetical protein
MLPEAIDANPTYVPIDDAHIETLTRIDKTGLALNVRGQSNGDNLHYNATGLHIMGIRMAEQVQAAKYNINGNMPVPLTTAPYVSSNGSGSVEIYWDAPQCRATTYLLMRRISPSGSWAMSYTGSAYRRKIVSGLNSGTTYDFALCVVNEMGSTTASPITTFTVE